MLPLRSYSYVCKSLGNNPSLNTVHSNCVKKLKITLTLNGYVFSYFSHFIHSLIASCQSHPISSIPPVVSLQPIAHMSITSFHSFSNHLPTLGAIYSRQLTFQLVFGMWKESEASRQKPHTVKLSWRELWGSRDVRVGTLAGCIQSEALTFLTCDCSQTIEGLYILCPFFLSYLFFWCLQEQWSGRKQPLGQACRAEKEFLKAEQLIWKTVFWVYKWRFC